MKLIFLGTGGSMPTAERGLAAIALKRGGIIFLLREIRGLHYFRRSPYPKVT